MAIRTGATASFSGETLNVYLPEQARGVLGRRLTMRHRLDEDSLVLEYFDAESRGNSVSETPDATLPYRISVHGDKNLRDFSAEVAPFKLMWTEDFEVCASAKAGEPVVTISIPRSDMKPSRGPRRYRNRARKSSGVEFHDMPEGGPDPHVELGRLLRQLNHLFSSGRVDDVTIVVNSGDKPYDFATPSELKITGRRAVTLGE